MSKKAEVGSDKKRERKVSDEAFISIRRVIQLVLNSVYLTHCYCLKTSFLKQQSIKLITTATLQ